MKRNKGKKKNNQFLMHPWVSGIGTGLLVFIITTIIPSIVTVVSQKINFFQAFLAVVKFLGRIVKFALTYKIPVWVIILSLVAIIFVLFIISILSDKNRYKNQTGKSIHQWYTETIYIHGIMKHIVAKPK